MSSSSERPADLLDQVRGDRRLPFGEPTSSVTPDFNQPDWREPGEHPELLADLSVIEVICATGEVAPVDRSGGVDREHCGAKRSVRASRFVVPPDELLEPE